MARAPLSQKPTLPARRPKTGTFNNGSHTVILITHCSLCPRGIYDRRDAVWLLNPLGLSHAECAAEYFTS